MNEAFNWLKGFHLPKFIIELLFVGWCPKLRVTVDAIAEEAVIKSNRRTKIEWPNVNWIAKAAQSTKSKIVARKTNDHANYKLHKNAKIVRTAKVIRHAY